MKNETIPAVIPDAAPRPDTYAFIIRLWPENADEEGRVLTWRGYIDQVGKQERLYFCNLDGIVRYIEEHTGMNYGQSRPRRPLWKILSGWLKRKNG